MKAGMAYRFLNNCLAPPSSGLLLNHIARETADVKRLDVNLPPPPPSSRLSQPRRSRLLQVPGFERVDAPRFGYFEVAWLRLPSGVSLHLIERDLLSIPPTDVPPAMRDLAALPRSHHVAFAVLDFQGFVAALKERGIPIFEKTQPDGKTKQVFFFDPDGNGLEVASWEPPAPAVDERHPQKNK